jgi:hypothetical protein
VRKIFSILLAIKFIISPNPISGQALCDTFAKELFVWTDHPPTMNITEIGLENLINNKIKLSEYQINEEKTIHVNLTINCRGEHFDYKVNNSDNQIFNKALIDCIKENTSWIPAQHNGQVVDYSYTFNIRLSKNYIKIIGNKTKRHRVKNRT